MEVESNAHEKKAGNMGRFKAFPGKLKDEIITRAKSVKKLGKDDPRRITHSIKVGLALTLVSLLYYVRPLYDGFGVSGMWAVLTVVVVFEFTVGGTLSKGLNRGFATLLAGALGVGAEHLANLFGHKGEPIVLGILVFLLGAAATFSRFFPGIKQKYDYGVLIFILTFSLVAVSGYRVDDIIVLAYQRLSTILIGGAICIVVSIFVCPVWAGAELDKLVVSNIEKLANYLEGLEAEYFQMSEKVSKDNKSFLQGYKSVLTSKNNEESFANLARWEPGHGRFRLRHPWKQYLKIGALARQCAYQIEILNCYVNSDVKASDELLSKIHEPCTTMSTESAKALKSLASAIKTMTNPSSVDTHLENSRKGIKDLKMALKAATPETSEELLAFIPGATVASTLIDIIRCVEKISEAVHELSSQAYFKGVNPTVSPEKGQTLLHRGSIKPVLDGDSNHVIITVSNDDSPEKKNPEAPQKNVQVEV